MTERQRRAGRRRGAVDGAALVASFVLAAAVLGAVIVVRGGVLDPGRTRRPWSPPTPTSGRTPRSSPTPSWPALNEQLLGDLGLPAATSTQVRALGTNVLRWAVPPSTLRAGTESVIAGALAYVRGDTDRLDADVADRRRPRPHRGRRAVTEVRTLLAAAADRTVTSIDDYRQAVADLAAQLAAGTVPASIPKIGGTTFDPQEVIDAILDGLGERADDDAAPARDGVGARRRRPRRADHGGVRRRHRARR